MEQSTVVFTWHKKAEEYYCMCGKKFGHDCNFAETFQNIKIVNCKGENCTICKESRFTQQWTIDRDGYCVCSICYMKCEDEELPKCCECLTYIDYCGISKCKECHGPLEEYEKCKC